MGRYTRKHKQHGKRKQHAGGTYMLPGVDTINTIEEFEKEWDTYYLSAHGALLENEPLITVPKNLYILFMGSAGYLCFNTKLNQEFEQCLIKRGDDCGYKHGTYETNFLPVMKNLNKIFPSIYNPKEIGVKSPSEDVSSSIYEPGDKIFDVHMEFNNTNYFGIRGLFQVPLQTELITDVLNEVGHYMTEKEAHVSKKTIDTLTENMLTNDENLIKPLLSRMREKRSSDPSYNRYSMSLSYILDAIDKDILQENKKTFLVIKACRRAKDENPETLKQVRRHSVELRKYNIPIPWAKNTKTTRRPRKSIAPKKREPPSYDEVYNAIEKDNVTALRKYVKEGFNINKKYALSLYGNNEILKDYPIFDAINFGKQKVFDELIKLGADVHVKNTLGMTTLFVAANKRQPRMAEIVLERGVDPNEGDEAGDVPINRAFAQENLEMIQLLIRHGARITPYITNMANAEDEEGFQNPEIKKIVNSLRHYNYKENYSNYFNKNELNEE